MTFLTESECEKQQQALPTSRLTHNFSRPLEFLVPSRRSRESGRYAEERGRNQPVLSTGKAVILLIILTVSALLGIFGGYTLYTLLSMKGFHYRAVCTLPSGNRTFSDFFAGFSDADQLWPENDDSDNPFNSRAEFFREKFDLMSQASEQNIRIDVPAFEDGRHGRFVHDFHANQSVIVDTENKRCFVMPLDRSQVMQPQSLAELIEKLKAGLYNIDTERVRRRMHVVTPPITDLSLISGPIAKECFLMNIYMLEEDIPLKRVKRETINLSDAGKFAQFAGQNIVEFDLVNIADIEKSEIKRQIEAEDNLKV